MSGWDDKVRAALGRVLEDQKLSDRVGVLIERLIYQPIIRPVLRIGVIDSILRPDGRPLVAGVFEHQADLIEAIGRMRSVGHTRLVAYSPAPSHELEEAMDAGPSIIRYFTFTGAILGGTGGFALAALTSMDWNLIVSGKPVVSVPPFLIIAFESAILVGAIATLLGFIYCARLPQPVLNEVFDPRFSDDRFGLGVVCRKDDLEAAAQALAEAGAEEVIRG